jgi:hypothetical protein
VERIGHPANSGFQPVQQDREQCSAYPREQSKHGDRMTLGDSIRQAESGGDPNAQNLNSSASGPDQFLNSTWLDTIKAARPDLAQGQSDQQLLALKTDPQLSGQMRDYYAAQNQATLAKAGLPVTPGNTYLAHFAGPQTTVQSAAPPAAPSRASPQNNAWANSAAASAPQSAPFDPAVLAAVPRLANILPQRPNPFGLKAPFSLGG